MFVSNNCLLSKSQRQLRYIEWMGVKIYDFQKATISTLFKLYNFIYNKIKNNKNINL